MTGDKHIMTSQYNKRGEKNDLANDVVLLLNEALSLLRRCKKYGVYGT